MTKIMAKCINNNGYTRSLTVGKVYEVEQSANFFQFVDDEGDVIRAFQTRFEVTDVATSQFKVGDEVKIRKDSRYYGLSHTSNPADVVGVITGVDSYIDDPEDDDFTVTVKWPSGKNDYRKSDLEHADMEITNEPEPEPEIPSKWANVEIGYY